MLLIFVFGVQDGNWGAHTICFAQFIVCRYVVVLANMVESSQKLTLGQKAYGAVYCMLSLALPLLYLLAFLKYDGEGRRGYDPPIPWYITCTADYGWLVCMGMGSLFIAPGPNIRVRQELTWVGTPHEAEHSGEEGASLSGDGGGRSPAVVAPIMPA